MYVRDFLTRTGREAFFEDFTKAGYYFRMLSNPEEWENWNNTKETMDAESIKYVAFMMISSWAFDDVFNKCFDPDKVAKTADEERYLRRVQEEVMDFFIPNDTDDLLRFKEIGGQDLMNWWFNLFADIDMLFNHTRELRTSFQDLNYNVCDFGIVDLLKIEGIDVAKVADWWESYDEDPLVLMYGGEFLKAGLELSRLQQSYDKYIKHHNDIFEEWFSIRDLHKLGIKLDAQAILMNEDYETALPDIDVLRELGGDLDAVVEYDIKEGNVAYVLDHAKELQEAGVDFKKICDRLTPVDPYDSVSRIAFDQTIANIKNTLQI